MFSKLIQIWKKHGFEIILGLCVAFILIYSLYRKISGKKGTWSQQNYYHTPPPTKIRRSRPPTVSKGEEECRRVLQYLFNKPFNKDRPDFLRNPVTGGDFNLELDCFDPELKIAVEYNGIQHYKFIPFFHKNKEAFLNQKYRDDMKRRICRENNILLIEVPYEIKLEDIKKYIENELTQNGVKY